MSTPSPQAQQPTQGEGAPTRVAGTDGGQRRRRWNPVLVVVAAVVVVWAAWVIVTLLQAQSDVRAATKSVTAVRKHADAADLVEGRSLPQLHAARLRFSRAHRRLSEVPLAPARVIPFAGRQIRSVRVLSGSAAEVLGIGVDAIGSARRLVDSDSADTARRAALVRELGVLARDTDRRLGRVRFGPRIGLLPSIARARNRLTDEVGELRTGLRRGALGAAAVGDLLGGPRRYLLVAGNNSEMRAGFGMLLSAGVLETGPEGMRLVGMRSVTEIPVPAGAVALSGDLAERWAWLTPNEEWRNLMVSPRFEDAAPLAARMWVAAGNAPVDGVVAVDPVALRGLLGATGPVVADGRRIDEGNVVEELLHGQYLRFPTLEERPERREGLGEIARAIFEALDQRQRRVGDLLNGVTQAARGRHLLLWGSRPMEQAGWEALGIDGALRTDSLLVSVINRGGNKLDQFLKVSAEMEVAPAGPDREITLRLRLRNTVPQGEPTYVAGPHLGSGVGEGVYLGLVAVNLPQTARDARFDGVRDLAVAGRDGPTRVIAFQTQVARGEERTVVARFRLPHDTRSLRVEPSARVPAVRWRLGHEEWPDEAGRRVTLSG